MKTCITSPPWFLLIGICALAGCQSMNPAGLALPWSDGESIMTSKYQTPERMAAIWTDATYNAAGKKSVRGFGGRLYFYNQQGAAVPVDGQLVVYAFDDSDIQGPARKPSRKYVFTPEQFTERLGETDLGSSYSIWLPWDEIGGEPKSITLLPIFTATQGQVVTGEQSINLLPGVKSDKRPREYFSRVQPESVGARPSLSKVQPAGYDAAETPTGRPNAAAYETPVSETSTATMARMETTTIKPRGQLAGRILSQPKQVVATEWSQTASPAPWEQALPQRPTTFSRRPGDNFRGGDYDHRAAIINAREGVIQ